MPDVESVRMRKRQDFFTAVADVASSALLAQPQRDLAVILYGVGIEVWRSDRTTLV